MKNVREYNHKLTEEKWQKYWAENGTFYFNPLDKREKYYVL